MSALAAWSAAGLAAFAVALLGPDRPRLEAPAPGPAGPPGAERSPLRRWRPLLSLVGGAGGWAMVSGSLGVVAALVCCVVVWVVLGRGEDPGAVRRREQLLDELPTGIDLLGACLEVGAAPQVALLTVSEALGGPVGEEFAALHHRLLVGVDPADVWRAVAAHPQLGPLGRAVGRAHQSGAPVVEAVRRLAAELRERQHAEIEERARSIEVKAAAPLGVCLLPAFVLLGVVPMVVGVFSTMRLFR